jgi:hypothetical protein
MLLPGGHQITSPGRISSLGSPQHWVQPHPEVTIKVWPSGWVCHALRAPGSKVTKTPNTRVGFGGSNRGSARTEPVKLSAGPLREGCEPLRLISIVSHLDWFLVVLVRFLIIHFRLIEPGD